MSLYQGSQRWRPVLKITNFPPHLTDCAGNTVQYELVNTMARDQNKFKVEIKVTLPEIVWAYEETENNLFWYTDGHFVLIQLFSTFTNKFIHQPHEFGKVRVVINQETKGDQRHEPKFRPIIDTQRDYLPGYFQK